MAQTSRTRLTTLLLLTAASALCSPTHAVAQQESRFFPAREYTPRVIAGPREAVTSVKFVFNAHGPSEFGNTVEGEVALATSLPLYLISGRSLQNGLAVGVEGAVFGRFTLTTITRDLISTDWIFATPFTWHFGDHSLQVRYRHTSSHIGDEYIDRFDAAVEDYSRDVADFTMFYRASETFAVYGGGNWAFNVHPVGSRRLLLRAGAQAEATNRNRAFMPYGAVDVQWDKTTTGTHD